MRLPPYCRCLSQVAAAASSTPAWAGPRPTLLCGLLAQALRRLQHFRRRLAALLAGLAVGTHCLGALCAVCMGWARGAPGTGVGGRSGSGQRRQAEIRSGAPPACFAAHSKQQVAAYAAGPHSHLPPRASRPLSWPLGFWSSCRTNRKGNSECISARPGGGGGREQLPCHGAGGGGRQAAPRLSSA